jgi:hypothetical protein
MNYAEPFASRSSLSLATRRDQFGRFTATPCQSGSRSAVDFHISGQAIMRGAAGYVGASICFAPSRSTGLC